jgi:hypothetical protein
LVVQFIINVLLGLSLLLELLFDFSLLPLLLFLSLDLINFNSVVKHFPDQRGLRDHGFFLGSNFRNILWLWGLAVQERHKDADLEHIHELSVEGLLQDVAIVIDVGSV